ncbi:MAG: hypothetical protein KJ995_08130 [Candidatus Omnitrophica bacterium]|nr:hypothetical protein [Candidatus Omnitrophota bacterium]MBU1852354.1 hypothetical protein [Candidatus Omnitrophota bacterium]
MKILLIERGEKGKCFLARVKNKKATETIKTLAKNNKEEAVAEIFKKAEVERVLGLKEALEENVEFKLKENFGAWSLI